MINTDKNIQNYFNQYLLTSTELLLSDIQKQEVLKCLINLSKQIDKRWVDINTPPEKATLVLVRRKSGDILMARLTNKEWICYFRDTTGVRELSEIEKHDPILEWQYLPKDKTEGDF